MPGPGPVPGPPHFPSNASAAGALPHPQSGPATAPPGPAQGSGSPASAGYGRWARGTADRGTVYGGSGGVGPGEMTTAFTGGYTIENTGSLTGHILAQGDIDVPPSPERTAKVVLVMLGVMVLLILLGLVFATLAGNTITGLFERVMYGG